MIYRFEKELSQVWFTEIEADSFEEAKELVNKVPNSQWDSDSSFISMSRCLQFENEDDAADFDNYEELEWNDPKAK